VSGLPEFLDTYQDAITRAVLAAYPPIYSARNRYDWGFDLTRLRRSPLGAQADAIRAVAVSLRQHRGTNLVGEMGTGKTTIGAAAAYLAGFKRIIVLCPPHLVRKWKREVEATVPRAAAVIATTTADLERLPRLGDRPQFVILSRERAKLSYRWVPAVIERYLCLDSVVARDEEGEPLRRLCCPICYAALVDSEGLPLEFEALRRKKHRCEHCGAQLWQADRSGPRRVPLADYIARRMPGAFELLIVDEQHEYKGRGSAQGLAAGTLAGACTRTLTLTGTLMGGYASTLFHLLWRFSPALREEFAYGEEARWVSRYGIVERITHRGDDASFEDGRTSRRRGYRTRTVEKPGISPAVLFHLIGNTAFLRLTDVASGLPDYHEEVRLLSLDRGDGEGPSQAGYYRQLAEALQLAVMEALAAGTRRLLAAYLQTLLAYPDACTSGETVIDHERGEVIAAVPPLPADRLYPKERALLELVREERSQGRRVLVYITHTQSRDIAPRLEELLGAEGIRVATLKADTVATDRREEWVTHAVRQGADVLLVHPRLVQTGLDLVDFPTICWYETEYSVYTMRQASRRSWRIGQTLPVKVVYLAYRATLQAQALSLVAKKLQSSLALEGDLVDEGLATHGSGDEDFLLTLARGLTERAGESGESLEGLFAEVRAIADGMEERPDTEDIAHRSDAAETPATDNAPLEAVRLPASSGVEAVGQDAPLGETQLRLL